MRHLFTVAFFCALSAHALFGQETRVSVGLITANPNRLQLELGASIDLQHRLSTHWELLSVLSAMRSVRIGQLSERSILGFKSSTQGFLGSGIGYRSGTDQRGFHVGLLHGLLLSPTIKWDGPNKMEILPAAMLNIGHSIGKRGDLNLDCVLGRDRVGSYPGFLALRYSYQLFK